MNKEQASAGERGRFVVVEGGEGVGKSTNVDFIARLLAQHGHDALVTREPGGTPLAEEIRALLLASRDESVQPLAETLLIFASRAQHFAEVIEPALCAGRWVLCDRFTDSTFAYQGGGRGVSLDVIDQLAMLVHGACWPDLTLYLDVPVESALARIANRDLDRFEHERREFFERARSIYRRRVRERARMIEIDASQALRQVRQDVRLAVEEFLASNAASAAPAPERMS